MSISVIWESWSSQYRALGIRGSQWCQGLVWWGYLEFNSFILNGAFRSGRLPMRPGYAYVLMKYSWFNKKKLCLRKKTNNSSVLRLHQQKHMAMSFSSVGRVMDFECINPEFRCDVRLFILVGEECFTYSTANNSMVRRRKQTPE